MQPSLLRPPPPPVATGLTRGGIQNEVANTHDLYSRYKREGGGRSCGPDVKQIYIVGRGFFPSLEDVLDVFRVHVY